MSGHTTGELRRLTRLCRSGSAASVQAALRDLAAALGDGAVVDLLNGYRTGADETLLLVAAAQNGDAGVVSALLVAGADPGLRGFGSGARTPLHEAARTGRVATAQALLDAGARVDARKSGDWTPLMLAARNGHAAVAAVLCAHGARLDLSNSHGARPTYLAARAGGGGGAAAVRMLLDCARERDVLACVVDERTRNGRTPLHAAATAGCAGTVAELVSAGADAAATDAGGMSPAHEAAAHGHADALATLLRAPRNGANAGDKGGYSALHHAAIGGHVDCVRLLRDMLHLRDAQGYASVELAVLNGRAEAVAALCAMGAQVRPSVLDSAQRLGHAECVDIVRKCTAATESSGRDMRTAELTCRSPVMRHHDAL